MPADPPVGLDPTAAKRALRATIRSARAARDEHGRRADDDARTRLLVDRLNALRPTCVAAYLSAGTEPDTTAAVDQFAAAGIRVLLPASRDGGWSEPAWALYRGPDGLSAGPHGIPEPTGDRLPADAIGRAEVVLCPGLAGTAVGARLGRGGGWYDRALPSADGPVILLLNDDEVLDRLPTEPHDHRVDAIVTPTRWIDCRPRLRR